MDASLLHVVVALSNPVRYQRRYELLHGFVDHMLRSGVNLTLVELQQGDREHVAKPRPQDMQVIHLRTRDELWHKENLINVGVQRLPSDWQYVAWVDADVAFLHPRWAAETVHQLQHFDVVQMFDFAEDIGLYGQHQHLNIERGFAHAYHRMLRERAEGLPHKHPHDKGPYGGWWGHCGYAWAMRRPAWQKLGGLIDTCILGSADHSMACGLVGAMKSSYPPGVHPNFRQPLEQWGERAEAHIVRNVGYVPGKIQHHFHGPKAKRRYVERWQILKRHQFDPLADLKRDWQGLWQLAGNKPRMRDDIRVYMRARDEDSNDMGGVRA